MVSSTYPSSHDRKMFRNVHARANFVHSAPAGCLLLDILKTMEVQFQRKGFLPDPSNASFHPLWFVATSERNNFLWRSGYSLNERDRFEFWVDPAALASKRMYQLELLREGFCFSNPTWGLAAPTEENINLELNYLQTFLAVTAKIQRHVYALSRAGLLLHRELHPESEPQDIIVLPHMVEVAA